MKLFKEIVFILGITCYLYACNSSKQATFSEIYNLVEQDNYFKAKEFYELHRDYLTKPHQQYTEAVLNNAFNQLEESEKNISHLIQQKKSIPDSLKLNLYNLKFDNAIKLYNYKEAKNAMLTILNNYKKYLTNEGISDVENSLKIFTALENILPQRVDIRETTTIKMKKDMAGLNTLKVSANEDSLRFIFDTGANLSTTSQSIAKQLKMKIIPVDIEVNTITGSKTLAQLAVCDKLSMGNIDMYHVIFLVLPDEGLFFSQINYQIYGILGFPVIEALKEIRITQDGNFMVPQKESTFSESSNMTMDGLTPLIYMNKKHFTFDTGADHTMLYHTFYLENKHEIDKHYLPETISFSGANGRAEFEGYVINYTFNIGGKEVNLKNIDLLKEKITPEETVYGNIGQDFIQKFDTMILNFDQMFIQFE